MNGTLYQLIVLLTTCNFPDVMLPAYNVNFWNSLYFILFLSMGLYLILNLLLANIFSVYQRRLEAKTEERVSERVKTVMALFDEHDTGPKGYLDERETKKFCGVVMDY